MKILFHTPTATLREYPRADDEPVIGLAPDFQVFDLIQHPQPGHNPATQYLEATEEIDLAQRCVARGWIIQAIQSPPPGWPNAEAFMEAFTMEEMGAVSLSTDPTIAALRFKLSTWESRVLVTDERVQMGLTRMVEIGLITSSRKAEIEGQAS